MYAVSEGPFSLLPDLPAYIKSSIVKLIRCLAARGMYLYVPQADEST